LIDFGKEAEVPIPDLMVELLEMVGDAAKELGTQEELAHIHNILREGTSADKQVAIYRKTNSIESVVDFLAEETVKMT